MTTTNTMKFKTRLTKDGDPVESTVDFSFDGVTDEQLRQLAFRSIIISTQAMYRAAGKVPSHDAINVADLLKRERGGFKATPESLIKRAATMTPEQKAQLIALLTAGE